MSTKKESIRKEIGDRLKVYRSGKRLKLVEMAELLRISHGSLSGLENGKSTPSAETLRKICLYTDMDVNWLLTGNKTIDEEKSQKKVVNQCVLEIDEWLSEEIDKDNNRKTWFEINFRDTFSRFDEWKKRKENSEGDQSKFPQSKIA